MTTKNSYYFHRQNWNIDTNPPGTPISAFSALAISAVLGLLFVIFLPVIGFVLAGKALMQKIVSVSKPLFQTSLSPISVPGEAHLTGHRSEGTTKSEAAEETMQELSKEIQARRGQK
jgi:ABC-type transport system involved in cytochrome bd biosynthesis fused ATPase/permease subunit